ncbi:MAG TPA: polysaccharide pyruvyl transferase CsaB [Clostridiales bacterium]|nr:MAG: polysaccharide pyruvyl transferase CsaB [Clostridiales bacterium GWD2_32_59]HAN09982.1 polysaccharide pyruvyl transferase CsaB [Clostridiales bacterium]
MKNILVLGAYGYENCGDDAILISIKDVLENINKDINITVLSNGPKTTRKLYGVNAVYRFNPFGLLWRVIRCNLLLGGGGTLLQDGSSKRSIIYYLSVIFAAKLLGKKVILYSNGVGPITGKFNLKLTSKIVNNVDVITFREESSREFLESIGVKKPKMLVTADSVFGLDRLYKDDYKYVLLRNNIPLDKELFGVSVREWKNKESYFVERIAKICDYVVENKNMNIVFLNMQYKQDKKVSEKIIAKMKNKSYMITEKLSSLEVLGVTANFKTMISMRLHGIIFAAKQRIPVAGLIYDPKVDYYLDVLDMPAIGSVDEVDITKAIGKINDLIDNNEVHIAKLDAIVTKLEQDEKTNGEELRKLIITTD